MVVLCILFFNSISFSQWIPVGVNTPLGGDIMSLKVYDTEMYAGGTANLFRSTNSGDNWSGCFQMPLMYIWSLAKINNTIFCGSFAGNGVYKSTNNGINWTSCTPVSNNVINDMAAGGNTLYVLPNIGGIFKSTNNGTNWISIGQGGVKIFWSNNRLYSAGSGLYVTTNDGQNWNMLRSEAMSSIYAEDSLVFAGTQNTGLLRSGNYGINFTNVLGGQIRINSIYKYQNNVFVSADSLDPNFVTINRFYYSTNNGLSFTLRNQGLESVKVQDMVVYNNYLYVANGNYGTTNVSVYKRLLQDVIGIKKVGDIIPERYRLEQNYPNPFNQTTVINFKIPVSGEVKIVLYDIKGSEVRTLVNEDVQAGEYHVRFDAGELTSGVYFYRIEVNGFVDTKKMMVVK